MRAGKLAPALPGKNSGTIRASFRSTLIYQNDRRRDIGMTRERNERFARLCRRACEIYEAEGRPHGRQDVHWLLAIQQIDAEDKAAEEAPGSPIADAILSRAVQAMEHIATESTEQSEKADRRLLTGYKVRSSRR
ncbi:hypothetical protein BFN67_14675 [Pseudaminobacter manganicus]|uniref:DUF2934 domain-containing protein n=2 Tax=Manganibacter manganicus TaxID=1873176 RepID=A0A1V8RTA2_9HYPH|nr:hypothetical protein BFN67_14675 [Pseudaminobacter manganicus]